MSATCSIIESVQSYSGSYLLPPSTANETSSARKLRHAGITTHMVIITGGDSARDSIHTTSVPIGVSGIAGAYCNCSGPGSGGCIGMMCVNAVCILGGCKA
jgi:hypothetical protein